VNAMGKFNRGNQASVKLSNEEVLELRERYFEGGWSQGRLAREYQVSVNTVGRIVRGESRQRVPMSLPEEDHTAIQARLLAIQEEEDRKRLGRLEEAIQKSYTKEVKPEKDLDRLMNWEAAERYGAKK